MRWPINLTNSFATPTRPKILSFLVPKKSFTVIWPLYREREREQKPSNRRYLLPVCTGAILLCFSVDGRVRAHTPRLSVWLVSMSVTVDSGRAPHSTDSLSFACDFSLPSFVWRMCFVLTVKASYFSLQLNRKKSFRKIEAHHIFPSSVSCLITF